ncbi:MAG: Sir2 family NAD-dependent protein deacetylase [Alphaproteobacteria bacterium]
MYSTDIDLAAETILNAKYLVVFTGAGISVESGIPPFRGADGLWSKVNPDFIDLDIFTQNPKYSWPKIKEIFYDFMGDAKPNQAHQILAKLEQKGIVKSIVTQNIDNLHQDAGSKKVLEFHGTTKTISCIKCDYSVAADKAELDNLPPYCPECGGLLKPDFIFFSESINPKIMTESFEEAVKADVMLVIGTSGDVMPACQMPIRCKFPNEGIGGTIIEINPSESVFTPSYTDIFLQGKAGDIMSLLGEKLKI